MDELEQDINRQTGRIFWNELEAHFASGKMISVAKELDLIHVAKAISNDDKPAVQQWMEQEQLGPTTDEQASRWQQDNSALWAVVIKPYILVQEEK